MLRKNLEKIKLLFLTSLKKNIIRPVDNRTLDPLMSTKRVKNKNYPPT